MTRDLEFHLISIPHKHEFHLSSSPPRPTRRRRSTTVVYRSHQQRLYSKKLWLSPAGAALTRGVATAAINPKVADLVLEIQHPSSNYRADGPKRT
jgi:hypothetical protein